MVSSSIMASGYGGSSIAGDCPGATKKRTLLKVPPPPGKKLGKNIGSDHELKKGCTRGRAKTEVGQMADIERFERKIELFLEKMDPLFVIGQLGEIVIERFEKMLSELGQRENELGREKYVRYLDRIVAAKQKLGILAAHLADHTDFKKINQNLLELEELQHLEQAILTKEEKIERFISGHFWCDEADKKRTQFRQLLKQVLLSIWDQMEPEIHKVAAIISRKSSSAVSIPSVFGGGDSWIIFFDPFIYQAADFEASWRRLVRYTIAHEFAHVKLKHRKEGKIVEEKANALARKWGFPIPRSTDPQEKRNIWTLLDGLAEVGERLDQTYKRLLKQGIIEESEAPAKEKVEAKSG